MKQEAKLPGKQLKKLPKIQGNPASLLCLNINSYMGGASDVWRECRGYFVLLLVLFIYFLYELKEMLELTENQK